MPQIPQNLIEEILHSTDIVNLVGTHVKLKRSGSGYTGLCPFHNEKTPSFHVTPSRNRYKCFGCGEGGDAARFLMSYHNLSFPDAIRQLAEQAGITIQEEAYDPQLAQRKKERESLHKLHREASEWFQTLLLRTPSGATARDYLKARGITGETARNWGLGYAPDRDSDQFTHFLKTLGYSEALLADSGIFSYRDEERPSAGIYPRFRSRLMFPIQDDQGNTIAFSGRLLDPEAKSAKYLNSPETSIFHKSRCFFGLHQSKRPILKKNSAIICEGQMDLITCFESGIENMVAPLGTAVTAEHGKILKRHAEEAVLCFDADAAGYKAALRTFATLTEAGLRVRAARMPEGQDPDSLIRAEGVETLEKLLEQAPDFHDYQIDKRSDELNMESVGDRVTLAREMAETISLIPDGLLRDAVIDKVSKRLKLSREQLQAQLDEELERQQKLQLSKQRNKSKEAEQATAPDEIPLDQLQEPTAEMNGMSAAEASSEEGASFHSLPGNAAQQPLNTGAGAGIHNKAIGELCRLTLSHSEVKKWLCEEELGDPTEYAHCLIDGDLFRAIWQGDFDPEDSAGVNHFIEKLDPSLRGRAQSSLSFPLPLAATELSPLECATELFRSLEMQRIRFLLDKVNQNLQKPDLEMEEMAISINHKQELNKELLDLQKQSRDISVPI